MEYHMSPPNLREEVIPNICANCLHWNDVMLWCRLYTQHTAIDQVCDSWEK